MSKCKMSFPLQTTADAFLDKAKNAISRAGGNLTGDTTTGSFHISSPMGKVVGAYTVSTGEVIIEITEKPMMVSCGMIEGILKSQLT